MLWALVLLALIVTELGASGRIESRIARNLVANAQSEAAADGAVHETIFHLSSAGGQALPADGTAQRLAIAGTPVEVSIEDEAGKINPNIASPDLLRALMVLLGANPTVAQTAAQAIAEWRGALPPDQQAAVIARYQAAGLHYQPSFAPFESVEDVGLVLGMPPTLATALLPHLSVNQLGITDPSVADPIVARAVAQVSGAQPAPTVPLPTAYRSVTIRATAQGPGDARFTRRTVVRIGPGLPRGYAVLAWDAPGAD